MNSSAFPFMSILVIGQADYVRLFDHLIQYYWVYRVLM